MTRDVSIALATIYINIIMVLIKNKINIYPIDLSQFFHCFVVMNLKFPLIYRGNNKILSRKYLRSKSKIVLELIENLKKQA